MASAARPPGSQLFEIDQARAVAIDPLEGSAHLSVAEAETQRVEKGAQLREIDLSVTVPVDALEAVAQWIACHARTIRGLGALSNLAVAGLLACRAAPRPEPPPPASAAPVAASEPVATHPAPAPSASAGPSPLAPLSSPWLLRLDSGGVTVFVAPPQGATAPRPLVIAVHGAGDRPEWSCGGWRLSAQASAFIACPQGQKSGPQTFAWASAGQLTERVERAVEAARARFEGYVDDGPLIFAGFSQGATLAEPLLRAQAERFPIAILAEGGYRTAQSPSFARAYRAGGGRRVVLVCGTAPCFASAVASKKVLEGAGVETLVVGDAKAGHNLNERMQQALQSAWAEIAAPPRPTTDHAH